MRHQVRSIVVGLTVCFFAFVIWNLRGSISRAFASSNAEPLGVSMVALLASPQQYDGKVVLTHGFLCLRFEGEYLYLHEEDYRYGLDNAIALRLSDAQRQQFKPMALKYVLIEGTVYANGAKDKDGHSSAIGNITRLQAWGPWNQVPTQHQ